MAKKNPKPYEILTADTTLALENLVKACIDKGHFEIVPESAGVKSVWMRNTAYVVPAPEPTES